MGVITIKHMEQLFWLGRYAERVYTTLFLYAQSFDRMIDGGENAWMDFCSSLDIPNIYTSKGDFHRRYCFDPDNPDSLLSNLDRAYDNAITLREEIGSESLSYIQAAVYQMENAASSVAPLLQFQNLSGCLAAFWGTVDDRVSNEQVRNILFTGKRVERIDLYARLGTNAADLPEQIRRLKLHTVRSGLPYNLARMREIQRITEGDPVDFKRLVTAVDNLILLPTGIPGADKATEK